LQLINELIPQSLITISFNKTITLCYVIHNWECKSVASNINVWLMILPYYHFILNSELHHSAMSSVLETF
jgi:hypothetical protein